MASIPNSPAGLTYLTQPGGILSNLPAGVTPAKLQSASPQDIVSLSVAAIQAQQVDGLFGINPPTPSTGSSAATATSATSSQSLQAQEIQALFSQT